MIKNDENIGNLIYLNPPLNNQENTNETKLKLNESYLKVTWKLNESMNVHESTWTLQIFCHECPK